MKSIPPLNPLSLTSAAFITALASSSAALADGGDLDALERRLDNQAKEIQQLRESLDMASEMLESGGGSESEPSKAGHRHGNVSAGRTSVGGYGELHYNNLDSKKEMDMHRVVLFVGHEFNDSIRFFMEWDLEHAEKMELEQAYLEFDIGDNSRALAGVVLLPFGIINETHEPPTFYGVERNPVETYIIPSTWREGGAAFGTRFGKGWSVDVYATSGLKLDPAKDYVVRKGRQGAAEAVANDLAYSGRLKWTGMPGVELAAAAYYTNNAGQNEVPEVGDAVMLETHAAITRGRFALRAVYADWQIGGDAPKTVGADKQNGWYVEPSLMVTNKLGVFARYNVWDNAAGDDNDSEYTQTDVGANYWPIHNVVLKVDYMQKHTALPDKDDKGFNLGVGYMF